MNDKPTLFDVISKSPKDMAETLAEYAALSPCELICGGKCTAINGFSKSGHDVCVGKILDFLNKPIGGDVN